MWCAQKVLFGSFLQCKSNHSSQPTWEFGCTRAFPRSGLSLTRRAPCSAAHPNAARSTSGHCQPRRHGGSNRFSSHHRHRFSILRKVLGWYPHGCCTNVGIHCTLRAFRNGSTSTFAKRLSSNYCSISKCPGKLWSYSPQCISKHRPTGHFEQAVALHAAAPCLFDHCFQWSSRRS